MFINVTVEHIGLLKKQLMKILPKNQGGETAFGSSHLTEALAAALGHGSNAALRAAVAERGRNPLLARLDLDALVRRFGELPTAPQSDERHDRSSESRRGSKEPLRDRLDGFVLEVAYEAAALPSTAAPVLVPQDYVGGQLLAVARELRRHDEAGGAGGDNLHSHASMRQVRGTDFTCAVSDAPFPGSVAVPSPACFPRVEARSARLDGLRGARADGILWTWGPLSRCLREEFAPRPGEIRGEREAEVAALEEPAFRASDPSIGLSAEVWPGVVRYSPAAGGGHSWPHARLLPAYATIGEWQFRGIGAALAGVPSGAPQAVHAVLGIAPDEFVETLLL